MKKKWFDIKLHQKHVSANRQEKSAEMQLFAV